MRVQSVKRTLPRKAASEAAGANPPAAEQEPVQTIIAQWRRERPDLDFEPMTLFAALARAYLLTTTHIDRLVAAHGLARGMFDVLATLRRAGAPYRLTPKELSASLLLSGAGMTSRLDRLEVLELVARLPEPSDRRSLQIQLTTKGRDLVDDILPDLIKTQRLAFGIGIEQSRKLTKLLVSMNDQLAHANTASAAASKA